MNLLQRLANVNTALLVITAPIVCCGAVTIISGFDIGYVIVQLWLAAGR